MDLNDLKSTWKNAGNNDLQKTELLWLTRINSHATLKGMRRKLIIEITVFAGFLAFYYDALDGDQRPLYVNVLLVLSLITYITGNIIAYLFIKNPIQGNNIKHSLEARLVILRHIVKFWVASSAIYAASLLLFLSSSVVFTYARYVMVLILATTFVITLYLSFRRWKNELLHFQKLVDEFGSDI